jgi:hypothetical protein
VIGRQTTFNINVVALSFWRVESRFIRYLIPHIIPVGQFDYLFVLLAHLRHDVSHSLSGGRLTYAIYALTARRVSPGIEPAFEILAKLSP